MQTWMSEQVPLNEKITDILVTGRSLTEEEKEKFIAELLEEYHNDPANEFLDVDEKTYTESIQEVNPSYQVRDREAMKERGKLRNDAERAIVIGEMGLRSDRTSTIAGYLNRPREIQAALQYASNCMPEAAAEIKKLHGMFDKLPDSFIQKKGGSPIDKELNDDIIKQMSLISKMAYKHAIDHAEEMMDKLNKDMTDKEFIEKYPEIRKEIAVYMEMELLPNRYAENEAEIKEHKRLTGPLLGYIDVITFRMNLLASPIGEKVDWNEYCKLNNEERSRFAHEILTRDSADKALMGKLSFIPGDIENAACLEARKHFETDSEEKMLVQDMEGNIVGSDSDEFFKLINMQKPFYMVPKNDPIAEPVLVQPVSGLGKTLAGDNIRYLSDKDLQNTMPVPKPNGFIRGLSSVLGGIGKIFGQDWRFDSCVRYDEYAEKMSNTISTYENYKTLSSADRIKSVSEKFRQDQIEKGVTEEQLKKNHEDVEAEKKRLREIMTQKSINPIENTQKAAEMKFINDTVLPEKMGYRDAEDAHKQHGEAYASFCTKINNLAETDPKSRSLIALIGKEGNMKTLYAAYRTEFCNERKMDVVSMIKDAAHHKDSELGKDLDRVIKHNERVAERSVPMENGQPSFFS